MFVLIDKNIHQKFVFTENDIKSFAKVVYKTVAYFSYLKD